MMRKNILFTAILLFLLASVGISQTGKPQYIIRTEQNGVDFGSFTIELFPLIAPLHSAYFDSLVAISFFDSTAFHRVVPDFVIQGGDPNSKYLPRETWGEGDPSQATILAEFSGVSHLRGIIGAARDTDINSASSQFYVNVADNESLDGAYTAFGRVISGMEVVDLIVNVPRDANDNPIDKIEMFVTKGGFTNSVPTIPELISPNDLGIGIIVGDSLKWISDEDVVEYSVQLSKDENFDSLYIDAKVGKSFYRIINLELGNIKYYWRVSANNGGNKSDYSVVHSFNSSIKAPVLVSPAVNEDSVSITPKLEWLPVNGATKYKVQVSKAPLFTSQNIVVDVDTVTVNYFVTPTLQEKKSHYWKVFSLTDEYVGPSSDFRRFVTGSLTAIKSIGKLPINFSLSQNYPNPFNPSTTIEFSVPQKSKVSLEIFNIKGELIGQLINSELAAGKYQYNFNANELSSGLYLYKIVAGEFTSTKKMLLLK
ncbi:MAG: peptidylprolyl isomerase [Bacteroidetes bacterium]|nr:peptidylprolyl isomerase [Bacteroidota bacterium]MBU1798740.1 peptidylprolyl isomerase [Bacteroidota bacterium]